MSESDSLSHGFMRISSAEIRTTPLLSEWLSDSILPILRGRYTFWQKIPVPSDL